MPTDSPTVALFDVDGTLIRSQGPSRHSRAFRAAFLKIYGQECRFIGGLWGMTDRQIFALLAQQMGLGDGRASELAAAACRAMVELYQEADESDGSYVALPGVRSTVEEMASREVVLGLVTGNAPEIAQHKLASVGLSEFFPFGAFGTEADDRSLLPPLAVARAQALVSRPLDPRRVFVIGDTTRDVTCALDNGLRAVAVATGNIPMEELRAAGAELVLTDLSDFEPLARLMEIGVRS